MGERRVELRYFAIALLPVGIFALNAVITGHMLAPDLNIPADILQDGRGWLEVAGRQRFLAATWFFAALVMLALAVLGRDLAEPTDTRTRIASLLTIGFILALVVSENIDHARNPDGPRVYERLGGDLFRAALSRGSLPGCVQPGDRWLLGQCGGNPVISLLNQTLDIVNVLAALGVGALIVGMILCLGQPKGRLHPDAAAAVLARNLKRMQRQLYISGLVLTSGMFFATSWMHWPVPLVLEAERDAFRTVVNASALFIGVYFSLLILSFYLPVALILQGRVRRMAAAAVKPGGEPAPFDVDAWKARHGLKTEAVDLLRSGFALAAPTIAAFAGTISPLGG